MIRFKDWTFDNKKTSSQIPTTVSLNKRHFLVIIVCLGVILLLSVVNLVQITFLQNFQIKGRKVFGIVSKYAHVSDPDSAPDYMVLPPEGLKLVPRERWYARTQTGQYDPLPLPVPCVIIHHTATERCSTLGECALEVRFIQEFHIGSREWFDTGYNFLVGGDGLAYNGRGWNGAGVHTRGYNNISIAIAFVGYFESVKPPEEQISACKKLINLGVQRGYIAGDYKVLAARQVTDSSSPGKMLYEEMQTWPHWVLTP